MITPFFPNFRLFPLYKAKTVVFCFKRFFGAVEEKKDEITAMIYLPRANVIITGAGAMDQTFKASDKQKKTSNKQEQNSHQKTMKRKQHSKTKHPKKTVQWIGP